jgi:photosystem II stability/assembly factor-like uncharacterized protein
MTAGACVAQSPPPASAADAAEAEAEAEPEAEAVASAEGDTVWSLNTYPGPGHAQRPDVFAPGEGSDRSEWISAFGVSPGIAEGHDTPLMLQVTDLGPLVVSFDGRRFVPADLPIAGGHAVAFSPHDAGRAYAFMRHDPLIGRDHGWWRTDDRGVTWAYMVDSPEIRGQQRNLIHDPHPARADHLYMTAGKQGVRVSTDDGATWQTLGFEGRVAHTLAAVVDGDQSLIYAVVSPDGRPVTAGHLGELVRWRVDADGPADAKLEHGLRDDVLDVEVHADHPDRLWLMTRAENGQGVVLKASADDPQDAEPLRSGFLRRGGTVRVNPANADHIVSTVFGPIVLKPYHVTQDGGATWHDFDVETIDGRDVFPALIDYGPFNHDSPGFAVSADGHNKIDGERSLHGFWPGDPQRVVAWFTNMPKAPLLSEDGGRTFTPFASGGTFKPADQIAVSDDGQTIVQAMSEYGLLVTNDAGHTWRSHHHVNAPGLNKLYNADAKNPNPWRYKTAWGVAIHPDRPDTIVATYGWGPTHVVRSEDGGQTWNAVASYHPRLASNPDQPYLDATAVFWHRQDPDVVYAGPLRSDDAGLTFQPMPGSSFVTAMSPHHGDLLVCREFGSNLWVSDDRGASWTKLPAPPRALGQSVIANYSSSAVAIDPRPEHDPTRGGTWRLLVGGLDGVWAYTARSADPASGAWQRIDVTPTHRADDGAPFRLGYVVNDPHPDRAHVYYASVGGYTSGDRRLYRGGFYVSRDHGRSFAPLDHDGLAALTPWWKPTAAPAVVHDTGAVHVADYTGLYTATPSVTPPATPMAESPARPASPPTP